MGGDLITLDMADVSFKVQESIRKNEIPQLETCHFQYRLYKAVLPSRPWIMNRPNVSQRTTHFLRNSIRLEQQMNFPILFQSPTGWWSWRYEWMDSSCISSRKKPYQMQSVVWHRIQPIWILLFFTVMRQLMLYWIDKSYLSPNTQEILSPWKTNICSEEQDVIMPGNYQRYSFW